MSEGESSWGGSGWLSGWEGVAAGWMEDSATRRAVLLGAPWGGVVVVVQALSPSGHRTQLIHEVDWICYCDVSKEPGSCRPIKLAS